jgi:hypothetical protein
VKNLDPGRDLSRQVLVRQLPLTVLSAGVVSFTAMTVTESPPPLTFLGKSQMIGERACTEADKTLQRAVEE